MNSNSESGAPQKEMKMSNEKRISQIRKSIALQERVKSNLGQMSIADAGRTAELSERIIATLNAQLEILEGRRDR